MGLKKKRVSTREGEENSLHLRGASGDESTQKGKKKPTSDSQEVEDEVIKTHRPRGGRQDQGGGYATGQGGRCIQTPQSIKEA